MKRVEYNAFNTFIYLLGCVIIALGVVFVVRSELGTSPWDTLHVAIAMTTTLTLGQAVIIVALVLTTIIIAIKKQIEYMMMALPIMLVGELIDVFDLLVFVNFHPDQAWIRLLLFTSAVLIMPLGGALLIVSSYPAGVFDELMFTIMTILKTSKMITVRILTDMVPALIAVTLTFSTLGHRGSLEWGTIVFVVAVGPLIKQYLKIIRRHFMKMNKYIDHTYLKAFGTKDDINDLLEEAITHDFKSVCVNPTWVQYAAESLKRSDVLVCTVIGFPLGASSTKTKVYETEDALRNGADEIDMVLNVGWVKEGRFDEVRDEIKAIKDVCQNNVLKVILETCYLANEEIKLASQAAFEAGADFVKTSTGFGTGGATLEAVKIMADVAQGRGVKASGGVKTREDFDIMVEGGATRIGTSSGVSLMKGETSNEDY